MILKRILSAICFLISISFFLVSGSQITGAAISSEFEFPFTSSVFGFVFLMIAVSLLAERRELELITASQYNHKIREGAPNSIVIDTSMILEYDALELFIILRDFSNIYVPDSVYDEVHDSAKKRILRKLSKKEEIDLDLWKAYRIEVQEILESTEKPRMRKILLPYLENPSLINKKSRTEQKEISENVERVVRMMRGLGINLEIATTNPKVILSMIKDYLEHCRVSTTDIDVLATALFHSENGEVTEVLEKDIGLRLGIEEILKKNSKLKPFLKYSEPYK